MKINSLDKKTDLYSITNRKVNELDKTISDKMMKWLFFNFTGLHITDYYGKEINYKGIKFDGSPRLVFWKYFDPFLENWMKHTNFVYQGILILRYIYRKYRIY